MKRARPKPKKEGFEKLKKGEEGEEGSPERAGATPERGMGGREEGEGRVGMERVPLEH